MTDPRIEAAVHAGWQHTTQFKGGISFAEYQQKEPYAAGELRKAFAAAIRAADAVTPTKSEIARLRVALKKTRDALTRVTEERTTSYQAKNGRWVSIQGDDGERCDIIHSDITTDCEAAVEFADAALKGPEA